MTGTVKEIVWLYSMGKRLRLLAICESDAEANAYMERHDEAAVIACFGKYVLLANRYDPGEKLP